MRRLFIPVCSRGFTPALWVGVISWGVSSRVWLLVVLATIWPLSLIAVAFWI
jgi:hypothetical protein